MATSAATLGFQGGSARRRPPGRFVLDHFSKVRWTLQIGLLFLILLIVPTVVMLLVPGIGVLDRRFQATGPVSELPYDITFWSLAFSVCAVLMPTLVVMYLAFPAKSRRLRTRDIIGRVNAAFVSGGSDLGRMRPVESRTSRVEQIRKRIEDLHQPKHYIFPISFMLLIHSVGFYVLFAGIMPLISFTTLNGIIGGIPGSVHVGFVGGWLYGLYAVLHRYKTADIPPVLVLQLAYQLLIAAGAAYFVVELFGGDGLGYLLAFAMGFVPYAEIVGWFRLTVEQKLGIGAKAPRMSANTEQLATGDLAYIQGLTAQDRGRLNEEGIYSIQQLALTSPLFLYFSTSYPMSQILDWINQAYLRIYVTAETAFQLSGIGIRGAVELAQVAGLQDEGGRDALIDELAKILGKEKAGVVNLVEQLAKDPHVDLICTMWHELAGA